MTAQAGELLIYEGETQSMRSQPLSDFFFQIGSYPAFARTNTSISRYYIGTWEILNNRLYLTGIQATMQDGTPASLETIFPGYPDRVFAHWYSDELHVMQGRNLRSDRVGDDIITERTLFIKIANGIAIGTRTEKNGSEGDAYGVDASELSAASTESTDVIIPEFLRK